MSTSGEQGRRPLTRRELRELRAKGGEPAVREALDAASAEDPPAAPGPHVVASVPQDAESPHALTRKELRRLRTNEVPIVSADDAASSSEDAAVSSDGETTPHDASGDVAATGERHPQSIDAIDSPSEDEAPSVQDEEQPSPQATASVPADVKDASVVAMAEAEKPAGTDDAARADDTVDSAPALNPSFGAGVGETQREPEAASFDDLMGQYATTSPSSIIMTSSHRLPEGLGSEGAAKGTTDGREADAVLVDGELPASSSPTPIAASAAISTQKGAHDVMRPPAPEKGRGLLFALGITAGILGIVAVGTLATLYFTGAFNQ
ncbi:hypothetical protein [Microbacterium suaedae]|uniref:hypothetical protein n=1 Tax=Microbacterium suaedae TaxID=2067813 RepID=UPI000DA12B5A|nr:hypothetical protein [Microbacterium suaedae]